MMDPLDLKIAAALKSVHPRTDFSIRLMESLQHAALLPVRAVDDPLTQAERRWVAPVAGAVSAVGVAGAAWYGIRRHRRGAA